MCQAHALETKLLRLKTPVAIGSRLDDWKVCWLGGWTRDRLSCLVMVVRAKLTVDWPISRLIEARNSFAGVAPFEDLKKISPF